LKTPLIRLDDFGIGKADLEFDSLLSGKVLEITKHFNNLPTKHTKITKEKLILPNDFSLFRLFRVFCGQISWFS
jgi:hypothetical protein